MIERPVAVKQGFTILDKIFVELIFYPAFLDLLLAM